MQESEPGATFLRGSALLRAGARAATRSTAGSSR